MFTLMTRNLRMFFSSGNLKKSQANGIVRLWPFSFSLRSVSDGHVK